MRLSYALKEYKNSDIYPFHMPGHKRQVKEDYYAIDITEIEGFDNLHHPKGIIKEEMQRLAKLYQAKQAYLLINGSTCGNLSAIFACVSGDDEILIDRNCHKSVYNAIIVKGCKVNYIYSGSKNGIAICPRFEEIKRAIDLNNKIKTVVLTSPTYEGYICDIEKISDYLHQKGIVLIVDSAHGAHLGFNRNFPKSAIECGADVVIVSLHKTLPALTQTAAMFVNSDIVDSKRIENALAIFETSSPSYVLMSSISECIEFLENKVDEFEKYSNRLNNFYEIRNDLQKLSISNNKSYNASEIELRDNSKILIDTSKSGITGNYLAKLLRDKYKIEVEYALEKTCLLMTSVMDKEEGFDKLKHALLEIDKICENKNRSELNNTIDQDFNENKNDLETLNLKEDSKALMTLRQAKESDYKYIDIELAKEKIAYDFVMLYPPGVPIVAPGEIITDKLIANIKHHIKTGQNIIGVENGKIAIICEE